MPATSKAGVRRRAIGVPVDAAAARKLEKLHEGREDASRQSVIDNILARQSDTIRLGQAMILQAAPKAIANIIEMAHGAKGRVSEQFAAACKVVEWARIAGAGSPAGSLAGVNLAELPLDQLESVLAGAIDNVQRLRSIQGEAQAIDDELEPVPDVGTSTATPP